MISFSDFMILAEAEESLRKTNPNIYINPNTKSKWRYEERRDQLRHILKNELRSGSQASDLWVHFSNYARLGINPKSTDGSTPLGIYAYPLKYVIDKNLDVDFAGDRIYAIVFKVTDKSNVISIKPRNLSNPKDFRNKITTNSRTNSKQLIKNIITEEIDRVEKILVKFADKIKNEKIKSFINDKLKPYFNESKYNMFRAIEINPKPMNNIHVITYYFQDFINNSDYLLDTLKKDLRSFFHFLISKIDFDGNFSFSSNVPKYMPVLGSLDFDFYFTYSPGYKSAVFSKTSEDYQSGKISLDEANNKRKELDKKFSLEDLPSDEGFKAPNFLQAMQKLISEKNAIINSGFETISKFLYRIKSRFEGKIGKKTKIIKNKFAKSNFPFKSKLLELTKQYNIDLEEMVRQVGYYDSGEAFLYEITKLIAKSLSGKHNRFYTNIWTELLRKMGIKGIIDKKGTGTIHDNEKTQGVFFDTKILNVITIINNVKDTVHSNNVYVKNYESPSDKVNWGAGKDRGLAFGSVDNLSGKRLVTYHLILKASNLSNYLIGYLNSFWHQTFELNNPINLKDKRLGEMGRKLRSYYSILENLYQNIQKLDKKDSKNYSIFRDYSDLRMNIKSLKNYLIDVRQNFIKSMNFLNKKVWQQIINLIDNVINIQSKYE